MNSVFFSNIGWAVAGNDCCTGVAFKVATITLGCIFSMLFSDFRACGPISIPTSIGALTEFFHILAMCVYVFLNAYHVYVMIYGRCGEHR